MTNLEITDGIITNYFFKEFFKKKDIKRIGIRLSSGTDSALLLFFLAKFITETESFEKIIFPWTGIELNNELSSAEEKVIKIVNVIKGMYPKVNIKDPHIDTWLRVPPYESAECKNLYSHPIADKFNKDKKLDIFLSGSTCNPPKKVVEEYEMETDFCKSPSYRNVENIHDSSIWGHTDDAEFPWKPVNKKFISYQYQKYNLMKNLYPLTESCVMETTNQLLNMKSWSYPCKKCFWCREKYWAFGSYDGGIQ